MIDDQITLPEPGRASPADQSALCLAVAFHSVDEVEGTLCALNAGDTIVGRNATGLGPKLCNDPLMSRRHSILTYEGGDTFRLRDVDSRNGTWVNGQRVDDVDVEIGDVVRMGSTVLVPRRVQLAQVAGKQGHILEGVSPAIKDVRRSIGLVAPRNTCVLITGEPGVGKELVARSIHNRSGRIGKLVPVNCGSFTEAVLQSELFGHKKGAFSGADRDRSGLVGEAEGGTLFLDEIGDAPPLVQQSLLRLLQEGEIRGVGDDVIRKVDVRMVAATNKNLEAEVAAGNFRLDLLTRLQTWCIEVPPLRDRVEDIPILARVLALRLGAELPMDAVMAQDLMLRAFRGNVRELGSIIERMLVESPNHPTLPPGPFKSDEPEVVLPESTWGPHNRPDANTLRGLLVEKNANVTLLAKELGVGRQTLYRWIREAEIDLEPLRSG